MAKLTLFFNNKPIEVFHLEQEISTIGRDISNTFVIDSLAIAPTQLKITYIADEYFIESVSEQFPVLINEKQVSRQSLNQSDTIHIGKHILMYGNANAVTPSDTQEVDEKSAPQNPPTGNLQVMNGANIGIVTSLNGAVTELTIADKVRAIIAKRQNGYYISRLDDDININIGGHSISSDTKLNDNVQFSIGNTHYLFFLE
jgi:pSer/pThr/pTyr-binding forkhead associated (FHA) protein